MAEPILVMDIGSWAVAAAVILGDQLSLVREPLTGASRWPASACLDGANLVVGAAAERRRDAMPRNYVDGVRRTIDSGAPLWLGEHLVNGAQALATTIDAVSSEACRVHGIPIERLVLTIPAAYRTQDPRREVVVSAASAAGFPDVDLVSDSVASVLDPLTRLDLADDDHVLVCDLGATWTTSLVHMQHGQPVQVGQETSGGGRDLDLLLVRDLLAALPEWAGRGTTAGFGILDLIRQLKHRLSDVEEVSEQLHPYAPAYRLNRDTLERFAEPALRWLVASARAVVARGGIAPRELSAVTLVGGGSHLTATGPVLHNGLGRSVTRPPEPDLAVLRGAARWAIGLPARAVPANDPPWRVEPVSWQVPSGQAGLVRWLVKEGEAYPAHAVLAQVRTADDRVFDLTSGRGGGVMLEHRVEVGGMVVTGAMAATVRVAPDADRYHVTKRHHLRVAGHWLLTPDQRLLVECSGTGEYVKIRAVASGALVNELRPGRGGLLPHRGEVMLGPGRLALVTWDADGHFAVWDVTSGLLTTKFDVGHSPQAVLVNEALWRLVTTADGVTNTGRYRRDVATIWDLNTGTRVEKLIGEDLHRRFVGYTEHSTADAFSTETHSPDGRLRAEARENVISLHDVEDDSEIFRADNANGRHARTAFSHEGRHLLAKWEDDEGSWVDVWEVQTG